MDERGRRGEDGGWRMEEKYLFNKNGKKEDHVTAAAFCSFGQLFTKLFNRIFFFSLLLYLHFFSSVL